MKIITLLLILSFSLSSFAGTGSIRSLVEDHQYFVTVEWDQKDMNALRIQEEAFMEKLAKVPSKDLEQYLNENLAPEKIAHMKNGLRKGLLEGQDPMTLIRELSREQKGASWNAAGTALLVVGGVALSLFVLYTWFIHNQLECDGFYDCHGGE